MRRRHLLHLPFLAAPAALPAHAAERPRPAAPARAAPPPAPRDPAEAARQALAHAAAGRFPEAEAAARLADPLVQKAVAAQRLQSRASTASAREIVDFALANPDWPGQDATTRRAEEALAQDPDDALAFRWFAARPPRGLDGAQRLADALIRAGRGAEATPILRSAWAEAPIDAGDEGPFLDRNATILPPELHARRFARYSMPREASFAARLVPLLPPGRQAGADARIAYATERGDAETPALVAAAAADAGASLERARWLRRRGTDLEAAAAFRAGDAAQRDLPSELARAIWTERQQLVRRLLRLGDDANAYACAAMHGQPGPGEPRQEAEFLAGFIALRRTNDPARAERHFLALGEGSRSIITRGRSAYWAGRAAEAAGATSRARGHYVNGSEHALSLYGQLAAVALGENGAVLAQRIARTPAPATTSAEQARLDAREPAQLCQLLAQIGEAKRARPYLLRLEELAATAGEKAAVARLALRIGRPDHAVWVTRRASPSGLALLAEGWPVPYAPPEGTPIEGPLMLAISRQESNFDPEAVSSARALGLMQLLPSTAASVARRLGLRHDVGMLTRDPQHNMRLGSAYLAGLLDRFAGALPLAIAGYNAGPGRVDEWLLANGDPRFGGTGQGGAPQMLDWMELIPFTETRNYVQRVLENLAIYRALDPVTAALPHPLTEYLGPR